MALSTYTELQASVADWLNRADLTTQVPDFIRLGEAAMRRRLRTRRNMAAVSFPIDAVREALPIDYSGIRSLTLTGDDRPLHYVTPEKLSQIRRDDALAPGRPRAYTIVGAQIEFAPAPDQVYAAELVYFQKVPSLSGSVATNWVLDDHPDLYLYASLAAASAFLKDDERIGTWQSAADAIFDSIDESNEAELQSGQPLKMQIRPFGGRLARA